MNDFITSLLNLKGSQGLNSEILSSNDSQLWVQLEHTPEARFCPHCNYQMHSKRVYIRTVYHPVLQDGRQIILKLRKRKWKCQNPEYGAFESDTFLLSKLDAGLQILLIFQSQNRLEITISQQLKQQKGSACQILMYLGPLTDTLTCHGSN